MSSGIPVKNEQVNNFLTALLLPSQIAIIKRSSAQRTESRVLGKCLADFHAKAAATESVKIVAHVDEIYSISAKNDPLLLNFCHPDIFNMVTVRS